MSNAYGAGSPQAGLNAPGGMPSWLSNLWNYVNPMAQATAGGVDAQGRPQDAITAAQQALAAQALNGGPQPQPGQFSTPAGLPTGGGSTLAPGNYARTTPAPIVGGGGGAGGGGATGRFDPGIEASLHPGGVPPAVAAYAGGTGQGPFAGRPTVTPPAGTGQGPFAGRPTAPAGGRNITVNPHARQQAQVAAAVPQVPWIDSQFERANLPAGNGPLGRNAQRQMGVIDFSKLFNRSS